ncbi:AurF N-oxygenase family protein [Rhodococcus gordoniae]
MTESDTPGGQLRAPELPPHDPSDPAESAVITGLVRSWPRRAAVKKTEVDLDALFDPHRADFPEQMLPFAEHRRYLALDEAQRARLRAWAWIAYNKSVVDIEQHVVNPGFGLITDDVFGFGPSDRVVTGVLQAMVDEQYHTLMHQQANALTRRRRGWALPESVLPLCPTVREHRAAVARAEDPRAAALVQLAFTTVAETSISAYLALLTTDPQVQPVNRATVAVHRRDELCHASLAGGLLTAVLTELDDADRVRLLDALGAAVAAFTGADTSTWAAIIAHENIPGGDELVADTIAVSEGRPVVQDCTAIRRLCAALGLGEELDARWPWPRSG